MTINKTDDELARQLWALGDVVRLRLLALLPRSSDCQSGMNVSSLAEKMELSQPTISHHLRILRQAGIIESTKHCRDVFYYINAEETEAVQDALTRMFHQVSSEV